jgi:hypothetical protein
MKKLLAFGTAGLAALVATAVLVSPALGTGSTGAATQPAALVSVGGGLDLTRAIIATARFQSVQQAQAEGYVIDSPCISDPALGGMGVHFMNHALANDPAIDPTRPEILVYEPGPAGVLRLVALEYFRRAADQVPPIDQSDKPTVFGQAFDGVMPAHAPHHGWHYDLHLWVWKPNPSGLFFPFNPWVSCPA